MVTVCVCVCVNRRGSYSSVPKTESYLRVRLPGDQRLMVLEKKKKKRKSIYRRYPKTVYTNLSKVKEKSNLIYVPDGIFLEKNL